jgi:lysozyme family protein
MIPFETFKNDILPITLKHEGGYVNDPADRGGETYRGVSRRANPNWRGWELLQKHLPLKRGDIVNDQELKNAVAEVYWEKYFKERKFNHIQSCLVALQLFDFAVNGGYSVRGLQRLLNKRFNANIAVDNLIGQQTVGAINSCDPQSLSIAILEWRKEHFDSIIMRDPSQSKFERGWNNRLAYMRRVKEN